ncbi:sodium-dependent transporter [Macrococcus hajekii]|uniref:Transporter n=1 Tax=Macrococcus hajekii TaxID=198482 RepID=A0A4R6BN81_9STAP|nr:sodium-dependent transporter [Macrococcus hajekii]TDM03296.1 sodium-dependent transporter [Macrococcus hajekii]GGA97677.1 transporter [Macrococcus hajekii]
MTTRASWNSKLGFILASAGSAIGLGAIWKFPYVMAANGGAAFLLVFLIFTLLIGFPLLLSEFVIGRHSQTHSTQAFSTVTGKKIYNSIGHLGNIGVFLLLSFYSVIGGWILLYFVHTLYALLTGTGTKQYDELFNTMISQPIYVLTGQFVFIALTALIVAAGIEKGIERASKVMMPLLFIFFMIVIIRSVSLEGSMAGIIYFLKPDFKSLNQESILFALGQSFFSLSVGFGGMLTYASYLKKDNDLVQSGVSIVGLNIMVTLLAGLAIFPATAALHIDNTEGPGLLFVVLPHVFDQLPFGQLFYLVFLLLFFFATITSSINLLEINVANATRGNETKRQRAVVLIAVLLFIVGIPSALSFGLLAETKFLAGTFFDNMDYLVSNILLPIGALAFSLFTGYVLDKRIAADEIIISRRYVGLFKIWIILLKYIIPVVIIIVMGSLLIK